MRLADGSRMLPRRVRRGVTLIEAAAVTAGIGVITLGTSLFINLGTGEENASDALHKATRIHEVVESYRTESKGCPTISQLLHERKLSDESMAEDPWGERFRVRCNGGEVQVQSAGRDRTFGTEDDLIAESS